MRSMECAGVCERQGASRRFFVTVALLIQPVRENQARGGVVEVRANEVQELAFGAHAGGTLVIGKNSL